MIGILLLLFVVPAFLAAAAFSIKLINRTDDLKTAELTPLNKGLLKTTGFIITIILIPLIIWAMPAGRSYDYELIIYQCVIVIFGPLAFGKMLLILQQWLTNFSRPFPFLGLVADGALLVSVWSPVAAFLLICI